MRSDDIRIDCHTAVDGGDNVVDFDRRTVGRDLAMAIRVLNER